MTKWNESLGTSDGVELYTLAEWLLDNPEQLAHYDTAKWNLIGHPDPSRRREGEMPWLTRRTGSGTLRAYTLDVFSGVCPESTSLLTIRKDRWTSPHDPSSWLAMQVDLETGETLQRDIWSARVDAARQMWLEIAPLGAKKHPMVHGGVGTIFRSRSSQEQFRIEARLDENWQADTVEYRAGMYGGTEQYEDVVALESMIIAVQQVRAAQAQELHIVHARPELIALAA